MDTPEHQRVCVGPVVGILHSVAPFLCMYLLWSIETTYRARYAVLSRFHMVLDMAGLCLLILSGLNIQQVLNHRGKPIEARKGHGMSLVIFFILCNYSVWIIRTCELALLNARECVRREGASDLIGMLQLFVLYSISLTLLLIDFGDDDINYTFSDISALLMWCGSLLHQWRRFIRPVAMMIRPNVRLPLERMMTACNWTFIFQRKNEFMFLMLGETVLQMVIVSWPCLVCSKSALGGGAA